MAVWRCGNLCCTGHGLVWRRGSGWAQSCGSAAVFHHQLADFEGCVVSGSPAREFIGLSAKAVLWWTLHSGVASANFSALYKRGRDLGAPFSPTNLLASVTRTILCSATTRGLHSSAPTLNS